MQVLLLLALIWQSLAQEHTPYGSKAPYSLVAGNILDHTFQCKPVALFSVHRHGTRNIGKKIVKQIDELVGSVQSHYLKNGLPSSEIAWILDFEHRHKPNKDLILEGYQQLFGQGQRFKQALPALFSGPNISIGTSYKGRCISSALSYLSGVYGNTNFKIDNVSEILKAKDIQRYCEGMCHVYDTLKNSSDYRTHVDFDAAQNHLLRYYSNCTNYVVKNDDKATWRAKPNEYLQSAGMTQLVAALSARLRVQLSPQDAVTLHLLCALEEAVPRLVSNSHWCSLFSGPHQLYTTAYYLDLVRYAGKMMQEVVDSSCVLLQDGLRSLKHSRGVNVKFAHTETLFPLLEHIGYLNEPMVEGVDLLNRQFFGDITPLGSNFAMVAMECPGTSEIVVETFLNEKLIEFPNCGKPCKLDRIMELFPESTCDFEAICESGLNWQLLVGGVVVILGAELGRRRFM